jgi:hypothetical protein
MEVLITTKTCNEVRSHHLEERVGAARRLLSYSIDDQNNEPRSRDERYPNVKENACTPGSRNSMTKGVIGHRTFLADQLVEPVICHDSLALCIGIDTVSRPWSLASIVTR